jgi:glyoxylase-like metal-dependent hydrolase (beta-lactamase superfamily II)
VFRLVLPLAIRGIPGVNAYVIAGAHSATLVDCGIWTGEAEGREPARWRTGWERAGSRRHRFGRLIITHVDTDHYGIAGQVARQSGAAGHRPALRILRSGPW